MCVLCKGKIYGGRERWSIVHITPLALGGEDTDNNMGPAHEACALKKTFGRTGDLAKAAKAKRVKSRHLGIKKSKNPLPGGKGSKWKKKIGGGVEPRD
jgi:5-methylcytosine-specific restriction endonuclease McrA